MSDITIQDPWVIRFRDEALPLIREKFRPIQILVFGSRAKGFQSDDSDLDVIIVSDLFKSIPFIKRYGMLFSLVKFPIHIDYICYTSDEFDAIKTRSIIIHDALSGPVITLG